MPIYNGNYVAPVWVNEQPPAIDETEMRAMSQRIEASQVLTGSGAPTQYVSGTVGQRYADTSTSPYTIYKLVKAVEDANVWMRDDANGNLALDYDSTATYTEGEYCLQGGLLYRANQDISTAEAWTAAHWTRKHLADDVAGMIGLIDKPPRINSSGYWEVWDANTSSYVSTGYSVIVNPPMVASTAAEMTNQQQVYVYSGNEAGYLTGYWYHYNGAAWVPGGVYQVAATDPTLSIAGAAADAKATGDAVDEMKEAMESSSVVVTPELTWSKGGYNSSTGEPSNTTAIRLIRIRVSLFDYDTSCGIRVILPTGMKACVYQYENNASNTYIKYSGGFAEGEVAMFGDNKKYKIMAAYTNDAEIETAAGENVEVRCIAATDPSLTKPGKAADAYTVGYKALLTQTQLTSSDLLDNITHNGIYSALANTVADAPTSTTFVMAVIGPSASDSRKFALLVNANNKVWTRWKSSGAPWGQWDSVVGGEKYNADVAYFKSAVNAIYNDELAIYNNLTKGNRHPSGNIVSGNGISTTELYELEPGTLLDIIIEDNWIYTVYEGNTPTSLKRTHRTVSDPQIKTKYQYVGFILYKTVDGVGVNTEVSDYTGQIRIEINHDGLPWESGDYERDIPENAGTANVIRRAYQMTKLQFDALADIPHFGAKTIYAETEFTGVPYSSVRPENLYVPQCVTLDSFMTALKNANSYIYTRRMNIPGYSGHTYMGAVCSSFVAWCYGITDTLPTTISFADYPGLVELPDAQQNWQNVKLGDMLNKSAVHIVIVTDIFRNRFGDVAYVELSESTNEKGAKSVSTIYYRDKITSLISSGYKIYRYSYIASVPYTESPWVHVDPSEQATPTYNEVIIPRRGDKANWHEGEDIVIDIIQPDGYTGYELREEYGSTTTTGTISGTVITLTGLTYGAYKLRLTGSENSGWVYFDVKKTQGTLYEVQAGRKVKVTPYIDHGTASSVLFCCDNPNNGLDHLAVRSFHVFTAEEISQGYAIVDAPPESSQYAPNDKWYMRCTYKTGNFGLYSGQLTEVDVTDTGATVTEGAYVRSQYIEDYPQ